MFLALQYIAGISSVLGLFIAFTQFIGITYVPIEIPDIFVHEISIRIVLYLILEFQFTYFFAMVFVRIYAHQTMYLGIINTYFCLFILMGVSGFQSGFFCWHLLMGGQASSIFDIALFSTIGFAVLVVGILFKGILLDGENAHRHIEYEMIKYTIKKIKEKNPERFNECPDYLTTNDSLLSHDIAYNTYFAIGVTSLVFAAAFLSYADVSVIIEAVRSMF